jgi:hypothetical protein
MPTKKKSTAKKTKKLQDMQQAHGKVEQFEPSTLEQIWGDDGSGTYGTSNENEYLEQLNGMAKVDMQAHATKVGLIPIDNMDILRSRLVKEFRRHLNLYQKPKVRQNPNPALSKEVKNILGEGK